MKTYKVTATYTVDVEIEISADSEEDAVSKLIQTDFRDVVEDGNIVRTYSEDETAELVEATFVVETTDIDYAIEFEDVADKVEDKFPNISFDSEEFEEKVDEEITKVRASLPQVLRLEVTCSKDSLDDYVSEAVAEETGWLVNFVDYKIVGTK